MGELIQRVETDEAVRYEALPGSDFTELHDMLLDTWLDLYEQHRLKAGRPMRPGYDALWPLPVKTNLTCMHNCPCEENGEYMFGVSTNEPVAGSKHTTMRLIVVCEACLRRSGAMPEAEAEEERGPRYDA